MKDTPVSNVERSFIYEAICEGKRTDGRHLEERRNVEIHFGSEYGSCLVSLGQTRVSAQVSCSIIEPPATRPNEGSLFIYVEFPPMCSQRFINRSYGNVDEEITEVTRLLERCLKESKAVDTESLCIVTEEKVWGIRLDIRVLNHAGNVIDCASIAGLAALAHFRRPDASLVDSIVKVFPISEKDPVKLSIHHYPVCTTYAFFINPEDTEQKVIVKDPSNIEEAVMDGKIVLGMNPYKEICTLHLAGKMLIDKNVVLKLTHSAIENSKVAVELIKNAIQRDEDIRKSGGELGLIHSMKRLESILNNERNPQEMNFDEDDTKDILITDEKPIDSRITDKGNGIIEMNPNEEDNSEDIVAVDEISAEEKRKRNIIEVELHDDGSNSEEESVQTLTGQDLQGGRQWYKQTWKK